MAVVSPAALKNVSCQTEVFFVYVFGFWWLFFLIIAMCIFSLLLSGTQ